MARSVTTRPANPSASHLRGFVQLAGGQVFARALTFVAVAHLARALGAATFGVVGFASAVAAYFMIVVDAGLDLVGMREIARRGSPPEDIVSSILALRLGLAVIAAVLLWGAAPWLAPSSTTLAVILAYSLTFLSFASNLKWGFQALEQNGLVATALALSQMVYLTGILIYVKGPGDVLKVPVLLFGSEMVGGTALIIQYRRQGFRLRLSGLRRLSWTLLREAFPLANTRALRALVVNFDLLMLGLVGTPVAVGLYTAVSRIILFLRELGEIYYLPLFPELTRAAQKTREEFAAVSRVGLRYAAVIIFPLVAGGCLAGPRLLALIFGPEYVSASGALCLLLAAMAFVMLTGGYRLALVAYGRQGTLLRIVAAAAAINIGMNLVLIPSYSIGGAALSAAVTEMFVFVLAWKAVERSVPLAPWVPIMRPALAVGGMAVVLWLLPPWPILITVGIAAASYGALLFLVGAVRPQELMEAWQARSLWTAPAD